MFLTLCEQGFCENYDVAVRPDVAVVLIVIRSQVQVLLVPTMYLLTAIILVIFVVVDTFHFHSQPAGQL